MWHEVAKLDDIAPGGMKYVRAGEDDRCPRPQAIERSGTECEDRGRHEEDATDGIDERIQHPPEGAEPDDPRLEVVEKLLHAVTS